MVYGENVASLARHTRPIGRGPALAAAILVAARCQLESSQSWESVVSSQSLVVSQ